MTRDHRRHRHRALLRRRGPAAGTSSETVACRPAPPSPTSSPPSRADHGEALVRVLGACSLLLDGLAVHDRERSRPRRRTVDVLPPFAGG